MFEEQSSMAVDLANLSTRVGMKSNSNLNNDILKLFISMSNEINKLKYKLNKLEHLEDNELKEKISKLENKINTKCIDNTFYNNPTGMNNNQQQPKNSDQYPRYYQGGFCEEIIGMYSRNTFHDLDDLISKYNSGNIGVDLHKEEIIREIASTNYKIPFQFLIIEKLNKFIFIVKDETTDELVLNLKIDKTVEELINKNSSFINELENYIEDNIGIDVKINATVDLMRYMGTNYEKNPSSDFKSKQEKYSDIINSYNLYNLIDITKLIVELEDKELVYLLSEKELIDEINENISVPLKLILLPGLHKFFIVNYNIKMTSPLFINLTVSDDDMNYIEVFCRDYIRKVIDEIKEYLKTDVDVFIIFTEKKMNK